MADENLEGRIGLQQWRLGLYAIGLSLLMSLRPFSAFLFRIVAAKVQSWSVVRGEPDSEGFRWDGLLDRPFGSMCYTHC